LSALAISSPLLGQEISNGLVAVRAVKSAGRYVGFDLSAKDGPGAVVRLSSARVGLVASECVADAERTELTFRGLKTRGESGSALGAQDTIRVALRPRDPYPIVAFELTVIAFDPEKWKTAVGKEPFHFLALYLAEAEAWHQRGWLNATPLADRFPLLLDRHAGSPEISAYPYNRNWSYTPPLGAHPLPVIGLWAPGAARYVGLEFQTTRLEDNSEKDIATGYRWEERPQNAPPDAGQFVALVYPFGGQGYQQLAFPAPGARLKSRATLLWSRQLPATDDPNRLFWSFLWERAKGRLPQVPAVPDVAWIPGGIRQNDFEGAPQGGLLGGVEKPFQVPGSRVLYGWGWHNESPTAAPARRGDTNRLRALAAEASELVRLAKRFQVQGEECVFWEKPLAGEWTPEWGGQPVTSLHNANGFAAGRLFLGLYRDLGKTEYLPVADGVLNWAKHIAWTRNEFADVPSSPFAIGGTLSASFCLEYYLAFKEHTDAQHRARARLALDLARAFTYRYMILWPSDNNRHDNLDSSFLWEPNSGRDWTGAACANEVFWNLDTLAQTAVHTGDPVLRWALQGSLSRWHLLYQDVVKDALRDYQPGQMTEGYGLYPGNVYGVGSRAGYGFAGPLVMTEPVGNAALRVLAGEKAALAFRKGESPIEITDYRYTGSANLAFTVRAARPKYDLALTVPYVDMSAKPVTILRAGQRISLKAGEDLLRPAQALWSLYLKNLEPNDRVLVGEVDETAPLLPASPPLAQSAFSRKPSPRPRPAFGADGFRIVPLPCDSSPNLSWDNLESWAALPRGRLWAYGVAFDLEASSDRCVVTRPVQLPEPIANVDFLYLLYSAGDGAAPSPVYSGAGANSDKGRLEALAWRAWPPICQARLIAARIPVKPGGKIIGINPGGRAVWALTALKLSAQTPAQIQRLNAAFEQGAAEWQRLCRQEAAIKSLSQALATLPLGRLAILPPQPSGQAFAIAQRAGLLKRAVLLTPAQLVDPAFFNAQRTPVALYLDGEDYLHTIRAPGDGAEALVRYLGEGGALVLLPSQPWPLFYANGPGFHRADALTERLGLPLFMAVETAPADKLTVHLAPGQSLVKLDTNAFPYTPEDPRLRSIDRQRIPAGAQYTPIASVLGQSGRDYGDAAGLIAWPNGKRILYVAANLQRDPAHGFAFIEAALRFVLTAATK
jgi:hypothetical protein